MAKTKYPGVRTDDKGRFFYETELGVDKVSGKRIRKKGRTTQNGKTFTSAYEAYKELTRIKNEYHQTQGYSNYNMTYKQFMDNVYIPYYQSDVEESTFAVRKKTLENIRDRFATISLRNISVEDVHHFRTWLLTETENNGSGYSQSYASLIFGMFRKSLDKAVEMGYLEYNISKKVKAISKGKSAVPYWNKQEFEKVINQIYLDDFYEHLNFVILWVYYMTGVRVNEGAGLWWNDVDLSKKVMRVHHMLILKNKNDWKRNSYTKTADGLRTISLDDDTVAILKKWKKRQLEVGIGNDNDFVFSYDGRPIIKSTTARMIERYSKLAGVKKIQAKGLRHSHASYLINEFNVSILILSQRMGHSSPEITLKHYSHMWVGADSSIVEKMTGNIKIETSNKSKIQFNGNQAIKKDAIPPSSPPKWHIKRKNTVISTV
ncbi:tyrosine-type recombinase/integrase [Carnobacterium divergens]|uniref:tyrosine-type recombinase/integrase n=1 Tax=Carnobacterium divergens TaxID=2748 RepID=UPI003043DD81